MRRRVAQPYSLFAELFWVLVVFTAMHLVAAVAEGNEPKPIRIKACTFAVSSDAQRVYYEPFVIVAEKLTADTADDPPAWWGVFPWRAPERDAEGRARAVNVPKAKVLRFGEVRMVGGATCRCPEFSP